MKRKNKNQNSTKMKTMPQKSKSMRRSKINQAAKSLRKEGKRSDFVSLIINMNLHLAWATETGHSFDLAREFKDTAIIQGL